MIGETGERKSAVATPDGKSRKKKKKDTTCLYNQLLAGYLGGSPVSTGNYGPLLCVTSDVIRTIVVWHRLNQMPT